MSQLSTGAYQRYVVPRRSGTALIQPGRRELLASLAQPTGLDSASGIEFCGQPLEVARQQARQEVWSKALRYTRAYSDVELPVAADEPAPKFILSGHQPELFHCGVWFKNFLLSDLAQQAGAVGINFLVDNDLCRSTSIRVPASRPRVAADPQAPSSDEVYFHSVPFDAPRAAIPWELRGLESKVTWLAFPEAVRQSLLRGLAEPLLMDAWPSAVAAVERTDRPGLAIAEMRHKLEQRAGLNTLEVPLSELVSTRAFARFSLQLLSELPRLQETYNACLADYRSAHRIRNHAHPVPALAQEDGWLEAPCWVYRREAPTRQALWVRLLNDQLILSDRAGWQTTIEGRLDCDNAASQWLELSVDGVCLRPRALLTTMYLRIMVSDLFIHGIGGGKYDQLTDGIVREFFGIEPSPMAVATATVHLDWGDAWPIEHVSSTDDVAAQRSAARSQLWQLKYHAEHIESPPSPEQRQLTERKRALLAHIPPRGEKWRWHRELTAVNERLSQLAGEQILQSKQQLDQLAEIEREQRVLSSREVSFCLFPFEEVTSQLRSLAQ